MKESKEGWGFHQGEKAAWKKSGVWLEDEVESRKKQELRNIEKSSCFPKEPQENFVSNLQQQLQEVEQRGARSHATT